MACIDELEEIDSTEQLLCDLRDLLTFALEENNKIQQMDSIEEIKVQSSLCKRDLESMVERLSVYEETLQIL